MGKHFFITIIFLGIFYAVYPSFDDQVHNWSRSIAQLFHLIDTRSYYPISLDHALPKALNTLINSQDHYCHFLGPREYRDLINSTKSEFFGIGVTVGRKKDAQQFLTIFDIMPNSPAAKQGLLVGDQITEINGNPVNNLSTHEAVEQLKGEEKNSLVKLAVKRNNKNRVFMLKRDTIKEDHFHCYYLPEYQLLYCRLFLFTHQSVAELESAIKKAASKKIKGIILDLRDNPGGVLQAAVSGAGIFLEKNSLVTVTKDRAHKTVEEFHTKQEPSTACPLIIVVNKQTASAAELFAGALQYYSEQKAPHTPGYIFLLGTQTLGKGSVQEVIPVAQECALCLTTSLYHLPDHRSINKTGIAPHFTIEANLLIKPKSDNNNYQDAPMHCDHQIQCASQLLILLDLARHLCPGAIDTHSKAHRWLKENFGFYDSLKLDKL